MSEFEMHAAAALERYENGESVEAILADYPEHQAELRAILETAGTLERIDLAPSAQAKAYSRQVFLAEAKVLSQPAARPLQMRRLQYLPLGVLFVAALVVLAWFGLGRSTNTTPATLSPADEAAPEETLEQIENTPAPTPEEVQLRGLITAIDGSRWIVDGKELDIQPAVTILFTPTIGQEIAVTGIVHDNVILVYELELLQDVENEAEGTVTSPEPGALTAPAPTAKPTLVPTIEPPAVTAEPTDDDGGNSEDHTQEPESDEGDGGEQQSEDDEGED